MNLQEDHGPMTMKSRIQNRLSKDLFFDHNRTLKFDKRSIKDLANREYYFERWRRLKYDIIVSGTENRMDRARELNVQGVKLYKEGKLGEAKWCFEKALSIDQNYENAKKNLATINKKMKERKTKKREEAKKGRKLSDIERDLQSVKVEADADRSQYHQYEQPQYVTTEQPHRVPVDPSWARNYRCPSCSIPVRDNWLICTNCGTDLRRYPPVPY